MCPTYKEVVQKMNCEVSKIHIIQLCYGQLRTVIDVLVYPYSFSTDVAATKVAGNSKLLYFVIKYVNIVLGQTIVDLNYSVSQHQDNVINRFDHRTNGIWRCGEKMQSLFPTCQDLLAKNTNEFTVGNLVMPVLWLSPSSRFLLPSCLMSMSNSRMFGFDS